MIETKKEREKGTYLRFSYKNRDQQNDLTFYNIVI